MVTRNTSLIQKLDWVTIIIYLLLMIIGWFNINSANYNLETVGSISRPILQIIWIFTGIIIGISLLLIDAKTYNTLAYVIYGIMLLLLIITLIVAPDIHGSRSWLVLGPVRLQPAEFSKFATALALAKLISSYNFAIEKIRYWVIVLAIILAPALIIVLQNETGTALVFCVFLIMLYREGMTGNILLLGIASIFLAVISIIFGEYNMKYGYCNWGIFSALLIILVTSIITIWIKIKKKPIWYWILGIIIVAILITLGLNFWAPLKINLTYIILGCIGFLSIYGLIVSWFQRQRKLALGVAVIIALSAFSFSVNYIFNNIFEDYQQNRIKVYLGIIEDPKGIGYNIEQAKIAIGSGGLLGKGYLEGTQTKLSYVPEQTTDFIFCTIGEEWGFLGTIGVILLYMLLLLRIIYLAEKQSDIFSRVYGYCVACIIFFHVVVNIGMVIGLVPVIGIPLPLISYGGSSLWAFTILLFIFLKLDATKSEQLR